MWVPAAVAIGRVGVYPAADDEAAVRRGGDGSAGVGAPRSACGVVQHAPGLSERGAVAAACVSYSHNPGTAARGIGASSGAGGERGARAAAATLTAHHGDAGDVGRERVADAAAAVPAAVALERRATGRRELARALREWQPRPPG